MSSTSAVLEGQRAAQPGTGACINFPEAIPGLAGAHSWELVGHQDAAPFLWLRSVDRPSLSLLVIDPRIVAPGYEPRIGSADLARIGLEATSPAVMLTVVTLDEKHAYTNLMAPILINPEGLVGAQLILDDEKWPLRHPIMPDPVPVGGTGRSQTCSCSAESPDSPSSLERTSG